MEPSRWLPAENDTVFAFKTEDLITKKTGVFMLKVRRTGANRVDLIGPKRTEHLTYSDAGITRDAEGTFLLKTPVAEGTAWPGGPNASFRVGRVGFAKKVEAGDFDRCAEVVETRGGALRGTITTTFCAGVGIVSMETEGGLADGSAKVHERAELRSFTKAVDIGPPGLTKTPPGPQP